MPAAKLSPKQARRLHELDADVKRRRAALEEAERQLADQRDRVRSRVPLSSDKDERKRKIRSAVVGGIGIRITPTTSGDSFSLRTYRDAGHEITPEMKEAITPGKRHDRWTVKEVDGHGGSPSASAAGRDRSS